MDKKVDYTDLAMSIYSTTYQCLACFTRIEEIHDKELLVRVIHPADEVTSIHGRLRSPFNLLGLRNNFKYWFEETGAMDLLDSLDEKLAETSHVSDTVVELLKVVLANMNRHWMQRVHTRSWYCDIGHKSPMAFEFEHQWSTHMLQPHPEYRQAPNPSNIRAYSARKQKYFPRDEFVCPLCEKVPEEAQKMLETGQNESGQVRKLVLDHFATELKSLSMMAVPSFDEVPYKTADYDPNPVVPKSPTHVDFQDDTGRTALSFAAQAGDLEAIGKLFDRHADVELTDTDGQTPLLWAAREGHEGAVKFLLDHGARTEAKDEPYGRTALSWAAANGHTGVARILRMKGADVNAADDMNRTPLSFAAATTNEDLLRLLLDASPDLESSDHETLRTPLGWATLMNRLGNVELLLQYGADIESTEMSFKTPLLVASAKGYPDIVRLLLEKGADTEASHPALDQAPLLVASASGHEDVVRLLLAHGAKVEAKDYKGLTARDRAVKQGHAEIAKLLEANQG
ncbi:hypothetical protein FPRO05_09072 [Fusarium proliferatum]|uniref:Uncharacterized protein n=1 Tax=Gibberella intermedia TaxID=948311 RepID=A0A365NGF1_GIBIN|nr:hypothetical protein FPRO05_09072 [Fusarium proliferatum]